MHELDRPSRLLLRLEGAALLAAALVLYRHDGFGWVALGVLALARDLSLVGYEAGRRVGTEILPVTRFKDTHLQLV